MNPKLGQTLLTYIFNIFSALEELKTHLENPDNFVEMKFLLLEQKYLELLYRGNSIEALKVRNNNIESYKANASNHILEI